MDMSISFGHVLTIIVIIGGFFVHYIAVYSKIIERIVRLEEKYESHKEHTNEKLSNMKKDLEVIFDMKRKECSV